MRSFIFPLRIIWLIVCYAVSSISQADLPTFNSDTVNQPKLFFTEPLTGIQMIAIPGGCFNMGGDHSYSDLDEKPIHKTCLSDFYIGKYEVTQAQWQQVMGINPSFFNDCGPSCPVEQVSWNDITAFIEKLNTLTGLKFRLPSEAEWEYACRQGSNNTNYCGSGPINETAWFSHNSEHHSHPVGLKQANHFGLHDMSGNVWEWVNDWYIANYYSEAPSHNPQGPSSGLGKTARGGSWAHPEWSISGSNREYRETGYKNVFLGFRLAQ